MAIINCPSCRKKISNVTAMCPYCGFKRGEVNEEDLQEFERRRLRDRVYHLKMTSYLAITLFLAAFGWYWWQSGGFQAMPGKGPVVLVALGAVGYLFIRVLLFAATRELRRLR
ncbi:MAG: hypothetical protein GWM87_00905 [Xanthomonadales bacterium]|nr:hypothetical protein [Xanthomonadales bacterium]NIX11652.1 hypothetical protein [Xanthomonadales bacterium]